MTEGPDKSKDLDSLAVSTHLQKASGAALRATQPPACATPHAVLCVYAYAGVLWAPKAATVDQSARGLLLLGDAGGGRRLTEAGLSWSSQQLPDSSCSNQWSLTLLAKVC